MLPLLRVLSILPLILAARIRREERRLIDSFRARDALDAARAVSLSSDGTIAGWTHRRLVGANVLRAADGRFYFDETAYARFRARRRRRAMIAVTVLVAAIAIAALTGVVTL